MRLGADPFSQRMCIYEMGETQMVSSAEGCPDPLYPGNPLIDWSEVENVIAPQEASLGVWGWLIAASFIGLMVSGKRGR